MNIERFKGGGGSRFVVIMDFYPNQKQKLSEVDLDRLLTSLVDNGVIQKKKTQPTPPQERFCTACTGGNLKSYSATKALYKSIVHRVCSCCGVKKRVLFDEDKLNPERHAFERDIRIRDLEVKRRIGRAKAIERHTKNLDNTVLRLFSRRELTRDRLLKRVKTIEDIPEPVRKRLKKQAAETAADSKRGVKHITKLVSAVHLQPDRERDIYIARQRRRRLRILLAAAAKKRYQKKTTKKKKKRPQRDETPCLPQPPQQEPSVYFTPLPEEVEGLPEPAEGLCYKRKKIVDEVSGEITHKIVTRAIKRNKGKKKKKNKKRSGKTAAAVKENAPVELPKISLTRVQKEVEHVGDAEPTSFDIRPSLDGSSRVYGHRNRTSPQTLLELVNSSNLTTLSIFLRSRTLVHSNYLTAPEHGLSTIGDYRCLLCREVIETQYRDEGGFYDDIQYFEGCKACSCADLDRAAEEGTITPTSEVSGQFTVCELRPDDDDGGGCGQGCQGRHRPLQQLYRAQELLRSPRQS